MKKIFIILVGVVLFASCSTSRHAVIENNPYAASGTGISFDRDQAYNIAYAQAVSKITEKFNINVNVSNEQNYNNVQNGGRANENLEFNRNVRTNSHMSGGDFVVSKPKYEKQGRNYICTVTVKVEDYNMTK